jgi:hypothetical protein
VGEQESGPLTIVIKLFEAYLAFLAQLLTLP